MQINLNRWKFNVFGSECSNAFIPLVKFVNLISNATFYCFLFIAWTSDIGFYGKLQPKTLRIDVWLAPWWRSFHSKLSTLGCPHWTHKLSFVKSCAICSDFMQILLFIDRKLIASEYYRLRLHNWRITHWFKRQNEITWFSIFSCCSRKLINACVKGNSELTLLSLFCFSESRKK